VIRQPHAACACGRPFDLYEGGILGRSDDMKIVRGTNVHPRGVEEIVLERADVVEFRTVFRSRDDGQDEVTVQIEVGPSADAAVVRSELAAELAYAHEGLRFEVELVERGSLPRFELKARRFEDRRVRR
jgi:phenylacetate-CoA ligase